MRIVIIQRTTTTPGPNITIDCPLCNSTGVAARTADVVEANKFFGVIPFFTARWATITCASCQKRYGCSRSLQELPGMSRKEISEMIAAWQTTHVEFMVKFCVIVGLVLGVVPIMGLIFATVGLIATRKTTSRWKIAARIGFVLSSISAAAVVVLCIFAKFTK